MNEKRRMLLKGGIVVAPIVAAVAAHKIIDAKDEEAKLQRQLDLIAEKQIEDNVNSTLTLSSMYGERLPPPDRTVVGSAYRNYSVTGITSSSFKEGTTYTKTVGMVAGPDGNLFLKVNDKWKRVLTA